MNPSHLSFNSILLNAKIKEEFNKKVINTTETHRSLNPAWERQKISRKR